ncbi:MAG: endonuclease NucS [Acidobacteria bacterium]|nr:endonuclease NucS [Acidobacteriota bacterium]
MADEVRLWVLGDKPEDAAPIESMDQTDEPERVLEDILVRHPDMLLPDLQLVGRQTLTRVGNPDLLGVDAEGRLVVVELKRDKLTRKAVAQLLNYGSHLDSLSDQEVVALIERGSGSHGIEAIADFEDWYSDCVGRPLETLRPLRMVLVGLGADEEARRIVEFLQGHGVRIDLLTFHGFSHGQTTILAMKAEAPDDANRRTLPSRPTVSEEELLRSLRQRAEDDGVAALWDDAFSEMRQHSDSHYAKKSGITFCCSPHLDLGGANRVRAPFSLNLEHDGGLRFTYFPGAVHLCPDEFAQADNEIHFKRQRPSNAPTTGTVSEEWFTVFDEEGWHWHRDLLLSLCEGVSEAWKTAAVAEADSESDR